MKKSFKYYLKKKRLREQEKEEYEKQKKEDFKEGKNGKKILKLKKIKKITDEDINKNIIIEKQEIDKIKKMENEEDLFNAILA